MILLELEREKGCVLLGFEREKGYGTLWHFELQLFSHVQNNP